MKRMRFVPRSAEGFALPTVLVASVIMLMVLVGAISSIGSASAAIDNQYYNQLTREAAEAGQARATDCMKQSPTFSVTWTAANPLRPNTDCTGTAISGMSQWLVNNGDIRTSFTVAPPSSSSASAMTFNSSGSVSLVRTSNPSVAWRSFSQSLSQDNRYTAQPAISGGAGWQNAGHFALVTTTNNQLYAFGDNTLYQVTDTASPASVLFPQQVTLPAGVASVAKAKSSGQGASIVCIIGNDTNLYCRGGGGSNTSAIVSSTTWQKMSLPTGVTGWSDFWIDGYGTDALCALGSDNQAYCVGTDISGSLGNGVSTQTNYPLTNPQKFILPSGQTVRKMAVESSQTCAITNIDAVYCAGSNSYGQLGAATTGVYATPVAWPLPLNRQAQDVQITYHTSNGQPVVHVLMTDGTIWSTGSYAMGDLGNGTTTGSTGTSQTPVMFNSGNAAWQTGGTIFNSPGACAGAGTGCCVDNSAGAATAGNKIQLYQCNGTVAQTWVYNQINTTTNGINPYHHITNMGTGMCMDLSGGKTMETPIVLEPCSNSDTQRFVQGTDANGNPVFHPYLNSGQCMDATGAGTTNGTVLEIWDCYSNNPQIYRTATTSSGGTQGGFNGWVDMITGTDTLCGVRTDNWSGMWCAGNNQWGQLMNYQTSTIQFNGPCAAYPNGNNIWNANLAWQDSGGVWHGDSIDPSKITDEWRQQFKSMMIIGKSGNVYGSGRNQYGKLGNGAVGDNSGTNDYRSCTTSQFQLPSGVTAAALSTRDEFTTYVLGSDNRIYAAGYNVNGQVGDGTTNNELTPVAVKLPRSALNY